MSRVPGMTIALSIATLLGGAPGRATDLAPPRDIVISEISYNPPDSLGSDSKYEFVEIFNRGAASVDVSGWRLKDRDDLHQFALPDGTAVAAGAYLVLARNAAAIRQAYGDDVPCMGGVDFPFGNDGDTVRVLDRAGVLVDEVTYLDRRPWPVEADGIDATLERISLSDDITDFSNFAASAPAAAPGTPGKPNSRAGTIPSRHAIVINEIQYNPVREPGADSLRHCPGEEFIELFHRGAASIDLSGWTFEQGIGFTFPQGTTVAPGAYVVVYHDRAMFEAKYGALPNAMGPYARELDDGGEEILLVDANGNPADYVDYNDADPWPIRPDGIQGSLELADPSSDNDRGQAWRESSDFRGTPGAKNSAAIEFESANRNSGPQITHVEARPAIDPERTEIHSSDDVRIDARIVDRQGVASATLEYQVLAAGEYIRRSDPRFDSDWAAAPMLYDTDRALWTAVIAPLAHRTLVRYRVVARDAAPQPLESRSPRPEDPEPNLAYFVYDGVPDYVANQRSAFGPPGHVHTHLDRIPVYHIVASGADIEEAQYTRYPEDDNLHRWFVTLVHGSHVHDHVILRLRSGHRYSWPKRPWKVSFNRGNLFDGQFADGTPYPHKRRKLHFMSAQHDATKPRGESGVFESLTWKLFREAGVIGAATNFVELRFVRSPEERDQFLGDFFGIFLETQAIDSTALEDNGRRTDQASALYKMAGGPVKKHPDCDATMADVEAFLGAGRLPPSRDWSEANLDMPSYLSFRGIVELADNHDMDSLKNYYYYRSSATNHWEVLPWDVDNTFGAEANGDEPLAGRVLPFYPIEYRNRFRELWQVHYDERRMFGIIDAWTDLIREVADADLDRWDTEPREACPDWPQTTGSQCKRYRPFLTRMRELKAWIRRRSMIVQNLFRDPKIPATPQNLAPAPENPAAIPVALRASAFVDPDSGDSHAGTRWMVIERGGDWAFPLWQTESDAALTEIAVPSLVTTPGKEYLFRAAYRDSTERWSLLSEPTAFTAGAPDSTPPPSPDGLSTEHVSARSVVLVWRAPVDSASGIFGYIVRRDGVAITRSPVREARFADFAAGAGRSRSYDVIALNGAGLASLPSPPLAVDVPAARALGGWRLPPGGLDYFFDARPGEDAFTAARADTEATNLDGTWGRSRTDDWDGSGLGAGEGAPGGAEVLVVGENDADGPASVLSIEDPSGAYTTAPPPGNQRVYLLHAAGDGSLLDAGVTLVARLRVKPEPRDLPAAKGEAPETSSPRGQIGVAQRGPSGDLSCSLWLDADRLEVAGGLSTPLRMTELHTIWMTVASEGGEGKHRVRAYVDGGAAPGIDDLVDLPSGGVENAFGGNYLEMGLSNLVDSGAIEIDYFGFKAGVHAPDPEGGASRAFVRGDADADGAVNVNDAIRILEYLFSGESDIACADAADVDDSNRLEITDAVAVLRFVLMRGGPPPAPFPGCGEDPSPDSLGPCGGNGCDAP